MGTAANHNTTSTANSAGFPPAPPKAHHKAGGRSKAGKVKKDIYQEVTDKIIALMEKGASPWACPWDRAGALTMPKNHRTGAFYSGINIPLLWIAQEERGFSTSTWLTYKQAQEMGGQVRKGEKGTMGIFFKPWEKKTGEYNAENKEIMEIIPMVKEFTVFNLDQIEGIDAVIPTVASGGFDPIERAEKILQSCGVDIAEGGTKACYIPALDRINMPDRERFTNAYNFYATAAHELAHATKKAHRCDRKPYETTVKNGAYAFEELVAELGSMFVMARAELLGEVENHASYLDSWLSVLKEDKKAIFRAASQAQKAADWILSRTTAEA